MTRARHALVFAVLISMGLVHLPASAQDKNTETKAQKIEKLRKALRGGGGDSESTRPRHPPPKSENVDMRVRAMDELKLEPSAYSDSAGPSVAVVRTQKIEAKDPVAYKGLQFGVTLQPYTPEGVAPLVTLGARDLGRGDSTWMAGLEARILPWTSQLFGEHGVGFRAGIAYSRQDLELRAPTGVRLEDTRLHALQSYLLLSQAWPLSVNRRWSVNADAGVSRFDLLLTSSSSLGEASDNIWLGLLRLGPSFQAGDFSFNLNYERRERISDGWARLAENGVSLGILYGIR